MKNQLIAIRDRMQRLLDDYQIPPGGQAEVEFKMIVGDISAVIDAPEEMAVPANVVAMTPVDVNILTQINDRLNTISGAVASLLTPAHAAVVETPVAPAV